MEDQRIVQLLNMDPDQGITLIMNRYGGLLRYLIQNTGIVSTEDQEECLSDIMFHVWRRIKGYDQNKSSFKTWLVLLAKGCSVDYIRKHKKRFQSISLDRMEDLSLMKGEAEYLGIMDDLQRLPYPDSEIFMRRFVMGEKPSAIAAEFQLSVDNVYKKIQRGRDTLKKLMNREEL